MYRSNLFVTGLAALLAGGCASTTTAPYVSSAIYKSGPIHDSKVDIRSVNFRDQFDALVNSKGSLLRDFSIEYAQMSADSQYSRTTKVIGLMTFSKKSTQQERSRDQLAMMAASLDSIRSGRMEVSSSMRALLEYHFK